MKKKILSLLLAVVMLFSVLPMSAISAYAAVITEETVVTDLNVGDIVVRGTNIKAASHSYKKKVNNRTQLVVMAYLTVNGEKYGITNPTYVNNDSCLKITSQESTVSETTGAKDYKESFLWQLSEIAQSGNVYDLAKIIIIDFLWYYENKYLF